MFIELDIVYFINVVDSISDGLLIQEFVGEEWEHDTAHKSEDHDSQGKQNRYDILDNLENKHVVEGI
jgi:hypothetical protein